MYWRHVSVRFRRGFARRASVGVHRLPTSLARHKRHQGYNVLHPMGFDAFRDCPWSSMRHKRSLLADTTAENIERYIEQLKNIGFAYDWDEQVNTSDPNYYRPDPMVFYPTSSTIGTMPMP